MLKVFNKPTYPVENKPTWWRFLREPGENINFTGSVTEEWSFSLTTLKTSTNQGQFITPTWADLEMFDRRAQTCAYHWKTSEFFYRYSGDRTLTSGLQISRLVGFMLPTWGRDTLMRLFIVSPSWGSVRYRAPDSPCIGHFPVRSQWFLSLNGHFAKTDTQSWSLPFFTPVVWRSIRRTSLLERHLVLTPKVSVLERVDCYW